VVLLSPFQCTFQTFELGFDGGFDSFIMSASIGHQNMVQIIIDNAQACKAAGAIVEEHYPHIFWTTCMVHTLNLSLKNICAVKNTEVNEITYEKCIWIIDVS